MTKPALEGVRVVDLTVVYAGPYATQLLTDFGAEVIRVESQQHIAPITRGMMPRPPKDRVPTMGPVTGGYPDYDPGPRPWNRAAMFNAHARNKLSMTVDLTRPKGMDILRRLVMVSDMLIENNAYGRMQKLGITYSALKEWKPDIIMISAPSYGNSGPYRDYTGIGANILAVAGYDWLRGYRDIAPEGTTMSVWLDPVTGATIAFAAIMALYHRNRTGRGQFIDFAQAENMMNHYGEALLDYSANGNIQRTLGNRHPSAIQGCYRCRGIERWVNITIHNDEEWQSFCRAIGNPEWTKDEKFSDVLSRYQNHDELDKRIEEWTIQHDHYEVFHLLQGEGVPAGPVADERDTYNDSHLKERRFFVEMTHPETGPGPDYGSKTHLYPGLAWKMSKTPGDIRKPPCRLGEDNEYVYKHILTVSDEEYDELVREQHIGGDYLGV